MVFAVISRLNRILSMADGLGLSDEQWKALLRNKVDDSFWVLRVIVGSFGTLLNPIGYDSIKISIGISSAA
jgi:D-serine dehydratase